MTPAQRVLQFFMTIEEIWDAIPGYVKVFLYSLSTMIFMSWVTGDLTVREIIIAVAFNLGIYQVPRTVGEGTKKMLK